MSYKDTQEIFTNTPKHYRTKEETHNINIYADSVERFQSKHGTEAAIHFLMGEMHSKIERMLTEDSVSGFEKAIEDCQKIISAANRLIPLLQTVVNAFEGHEK